MPQGQLAGAIEAPLRKVWRRVGSGVGTGTARLVADRPITDRAWEYARLRGRLARSVRVWHRYSSAPPRYLGYWH